MDDREEAENSVRILRLRETFIAQQPTYCIFEQRIERGMSSSTTSSSSSALSSRQEVEISSILEYAGKNNGQNISRNAATAVATSDGDHSRLPPSPLVTPPGGRSVRDRQPEGNNTDLNLDQKSTSSGSKRGIPHIYHDYSNIPDAIGYIRKKTGGVTQPFPEKLHEMLEAVEGDSRRIVYWLPHGRAFLVEKPKEFTSEIMPK